MIKHAKGLPVWLATGIDTLLVVLALTWAVMPALTKLARPWLVGRPPEERKERNGP